MPCSIFGVAMVGLGLASRRLCHGFVAVSNFRGRQIMYPALYTPCRKARHDGGEFTSVARRASGMRDGSTACMSCIGQHTARTVASSLGGATAAVVLRGGSMEHNVMAGVLGELSNIRTPAALLGGAALGTMFVQPKPGGNNRLHLLYTILSTSAFALQLMCVLCSTLTYTAVASLPEAMAESTISFLANQMQWEFFVIRGSFVYGLFSFLGALTVRGWMTFSADGEQWSARMITAILGSSTIFLLNFLHYTHNPLTLCLGGMTKTLVSLTLSNMYSTKKRFVRHTVAAAAIWGAVKLLKLGPNDGATTNETEARSLSTTTPPAANPSKNSDKI